jgi:two-component system chemotaxis sensor kinase CheA
MADNDDIVKEFLVESYENLDRLDQELLQLEKAGGDRQTLSSIFRTIHTIKGTCGFLGFGRLESVSHVGENLLSRLRDGELPVTPKVISGLLAMVDRVRRMLGLIESSGCDGNEDHADLIAVLTALLKDGGSTAAEQVASATSADAPPATSHETPVATPSAVDASAVETTAPAVAGSAATAPEAVKAPAAPAASPEPTTRADHPAGDHDTPNASGNAHTVSDSTIRVDVSLLDKLMNLVGELVLARNQVLQYSAGVDHSGLQATTQRLNHVTTELQEGVMKTRMQPIGNIWSKFPRVVRDLAVMCGKQIRVEMEGKETELDKTIIEAIKDPLTHVVRNSADHGIEPPDVRVRNGKPAEGRLFLRAYHEGGQVNIEISDDGAGINVERVKAKAIKLGLITSEQATRMSDREAVNLIFLPGFSTAEKVTNVSGRGVGMDVVKTNIERIGGALDVQSVSGKGTTLRIKIPLTLAIIPALIITSAGERYAIPQVSLVELLRLDGDDANRCIERVHGMPVYRLRGRLLPLVSLDEALGVKRTGHAIERAHTIVVLGADDRQFGLIVDDVCDTEEIVVKPLSKQLKGVNAYAGATIMGDGKVALILDAVGLAQAANISAEARAAIAQSGEAAHTAGEAVTRQTLLLLGIGRGRRVAIPLSAVARLEEFESQAVERVGDLRAVQYRGEIMPLLDLSRALGEGDLPESKSSRIQAVVYTSGSRRVGLVVGEILDIVEEAIVPQPTGIAHGVIGTVPIQGRITELLDLPTLVRPVLSTGPAVRAIAA